MKKICRHGATATLFILILASLACMTSTIPPQARTTTIPIEEKDIAPTSTAMADLSETEPAAGAVFDLQNCGRDSSPAQFCRPTPGRLCATVTAIQSLHLRDQPNEKARVLAYLENGEQVRVIIFGQWWKISTDKGTGYANAKYLRLTECEK